MSKTVHSRLPKRLNPQAIADRDLALVGQMPADSMPRLREAVISIASAASVDLQLVREPTGCRVDGKIACMLGLRCARCLREVLVRVSPHVRLIVRSSLEGLTGAPEGYDLHEYEGHSLELSHLVEDELLLALPLVPKHEDISLCGQGMIAWLGSKGRASDPARNPFAVLKRT